MTEICQDICRAVISACLRVVEFVDLGTEHQGECLRQRDADRRDQAAFDRAVAQCGARGRDFDIGHHRNRQRAAIVADQIDLEPYDAVGAARDCAATGSGTDNRAFKRRCLHFDVDRVGQAKLQCGIDNGPRANVCAILSCHGIDSQIGLVLEMALIDGIGHVGFGWPVGAEAARCRCGHWRGRRGQCGVGRGLGSWRRRTGVGLRCAGCQHNPQRGARNRNPTADAADLNHSGDFSRVVASQGSGCCGGLSLALHGHWVTSILWFNT